MRLPGGEESNLGDRFGGVPISAAVRVAPICSRHCFNCVTISPGPPPRSLMRAGQEMIIGLRVPPKWLATCLVHWNGVSIACAQADRKWL